MSIPELSSNQVIKVRSACLKNSKQWLAAAKFIFESDSQNRNIAYNLASLALEETAKANLISMRQHSSVERRDYFLGNRNLDDHVKKLFWALWTPLFGSEQITGQKLDNLKGLANSIYKKRLACTYVNVEDKGRRLPSEAVTAKETDELIRICESRILMEENQRVENLPKELQKDLDWFLEVSDDELERKYILSSESMKKLAELKSPALWIQWLHSENEKRLEESKAILKQEIERKRPKGKSANKPKWRLKIRIFSASHTFRQSALNWWNDLNSSIKLYAVTGTKKREILVEFTLPRKIPLGGLWWLGLTYSQRFILALNISTFGFHWWYIPRQTDKYYEEIEDLDRHAFVGVERSPRLEIKWNSGAMKADDFVRVAIIFRELPYSDEQSRHEPFNHYLTALGALAKTDIHLQFEETAFMHFYLSLKTGFKAYGHLKVKEDFSKTLITWKERIVPDEFDLDRLLAYGEDIKQSRTTLGPVTLKEVGQMKFICDAFYCLEFSDSPRVKSPKTPLN